MSAWSNVPAISILNAQVVCLQGVGCATWIESTQATSSERPTIGADVDAKRAYERLG